jgi:hypothetical protein
MTFGGTGGGRKKKKRDQVRSVLGAAVCSFLVLETSLGSQAVAAVADPGSGQTMLVPIAPKMEMPAGIPTAPQTEATASSEPAGTLLLPLTPKLDEGTNPAFDTSPPEKKAATDGDGDLTTLRKAKATTGELETLPNVIKPETGDIIDAGRVEDDEEKSDGPLMKGMVQITADDTEYDEEKNTFLGTGNAVALIGGQNSKLEADTILYNQNDQMMDARGNVHIMRNGQLTTGSAFKFKISSDEYLITNPDTDLAGSQVIARWAIGKGGGADFHDGVLQMPRPFYMAKNAGFGPQSYQDILPEMSKHPDAFVPPQQAWKFKARKIVYERYKDEENLTIFGGKLMFGNFGVPLPKMVTTIGGDQGRMFLPISAEMGSNLQSGGTNIGPAFSNLVGKTGILMWAPMVQFGGTNLAGVSSNKIGLSGQTAFTNNFMTAHLAYGSTTNVLVGDLKARIRKGFTFQSGINRYLQDGMFGANRARLRAELVDTHSVGNIPFLSGVTFRTSAGWSQDNPQLLNQQAQYRALFGNVNTNSNVMNSAFKVQEQISGTTQPIFTAGDSRYGVKGYIYGGIAGRGYSTGDKNMLAQAGPMMDCYLGRLRARVGYTQSDYQGTSPFVYDSFLQGARSVQLSGDYKVCKYLDVGGSMGYNLVSKLYYGKTLTAAIGPDDFKLLLTDSLIQGNYRVGFSVLYGQSIPFDKLVLKGNADQGQLGGI